MGKLNWERLAAASGAVFVALFVAGFVLAVSDQPSLGDPNADWVAWVRDHVRELKVATILLGLALVAFLWFVGSVAGALRKAGEERLASVATASGAAMATLALLGVALVTALAYRVSAEAPRLTKPLFEVQLVVFTLISFPVAAFAYTTAVATWRSRLFPGWYAPAGGLAALAFLFGGGALAAKGFYAPDGGYALITTIAFLVWVLVTSLLLAFEVRGKRTEAGSTV